MISLRSSFPPLYRAAHISHARILIYFIPFRLIYIILVAALCLRTILLFYIICGKSLERVFIERTFLVLKVAAAEKFSRFREETARPLLSLRSSGSGFRVRFSPHRDPSNLGARSISSDEIRAGRSFRLSKTSHETGVSARTRDLARIMYARCLPRRG